MPAARHLSAEAVIPLKAPASVMSQLREHLAEHGTVSGSDTAWSIDVEIGVATARLRDGGIAFRVEAGDDTSLSFLQWSVAEHVYEYAPGESPPVVWQGGVTPGTTPPYFRKMTVVRTADVTPLMRRITLKGDDLGRFSHDGLHVRLLFPPKPGVTPVWPIIGADGRQAWPEGVRPVSRVYTIRRIDVPAGEIDVDFVLHDGDDMPGAQFGRDAAPGDIVGMTGPGGGNLAESARYIFAGDETALPAIARMLEELPASAAATALVEIDGNAERQELPGRPGIDIRWLPRDGRPAGATDLLYDALTTLCAADGERDSYIWVGCEQAAARRIRDHLKRERCLPRSRYLVAAYWRRGHAGEVEE